MSGYDEVLASSWELRLGRLVIEDYWMTGLLMLDAGLDSIARPPSGRLLGFVVDPQPKGFPEVSSMSIKDEKKSSGTIWGDKSRSNLDVEKQEKVGSLTFKVIDASSQKSSTEQAGSNVESSQGIKSGVIKPASRAKVPFQIGYSHMDWLKVTRTHPDLAGLKGQSNKRLIPLSEVKQHNTEDSMWTVLKGRVYNITPYMKFHPGGVDMLMKAVGKDCTALFSGKRKTAWKKQLMVMGEEDGSRATDCFKGENVGNLMGKEAAGSRDSGGGGSLENKLPHWLRKAVRHGGGDVPS
ncbi:hypothetical protein R6Q59_023781 [Mikania micrantha]